MTWLRVFVVLGVIAGEAAAGLPREPCIDETSTEAGYIPGALYLGVLAKPNPCATIFDYRGFDRFPLLFEAGGLFQLDAGTSQEHGVGVRRARLTVSTALWRRFIVVVSGDAAERSVPDAFLRLDLVSPSAVISERDHYVALWLDAGRRVVPFGLEAQWSDAKLPFLERTTTLEQLAPAQRQHGVSLAAVRVRRLEVPPDASDTERDLIWHAALGVFQPFDERQSITAIGRAFGRLQRRNEANGLAIDLHLGASAAVGRRISDATTDTRAHGDERRFAIEAEARYRRVRGTIELISTSQQMQSRKGANATMHGIGGALTLNATLRPNPYRWYTSPQLRGPIHHPVHINARDATGPNVGVEIDAGIDVMRGELAAVELSHTKLRTAAHLFFDDHAKLSCAYAYETERGEHSITARLQLAF